MQRNIGFVSARAALLGTTVLAFGSLAHAQEATMETVTVTGYRASLQDSTNAKRASVGFTDSVFAEDIGKFPDTNIAESLNRIPGITINRDITGEGVQIQIRGLGTSFTRVLLDGNPVYMASTGTTDAQSTNREVDLNMLPSELFTQLTVDKSARADFVEGGAAGTVNMRSARPFDNPGYHLSYNLQGTQSSNDHAGLGERGTVIASATQGPLGILIGLTGQRYRQYTKGFETIGWTTPSLDSAMCPADDCNSIGGGNWTIPSTVPDNVTTGGLVPGATVDQTMLTSLNPGLSVEQIGKALIPRLGRPMYEKGTRSRYNGVASIEYRPTNAMHFFLDFVGGRSDNNFDRSDIDWVGRNGSMIPIGLTVDSNGVVTSGTFANSQLFLEARPYKEGADFVDLHPGLDWQVNDMWHVGVEAYVTRSHFLRDSPTILVVTPPSSQTSPLIPGQPVAPAGGVVVNYTNTGSVPTIAANIDLNNPANFQWAGGRVNVQSEKRYTETDGYHISTQYGGDAFNVKAGLAYDDAYRNITGYNNDQAWQNAICGNNPSAFVPGPNTEPPCQGLNMPGSPAAVNAFDSAYPTWPGLGTGYSSNLGSTFTYQGSYIPQSALASYLKPGPEGFITADYGKIKQDAHYADFAYPNAPVSSGANTGASAGTVDEKDWGLFGEVNGIWNVGGRDLKFNVGLRWVETHQTISGLVSHADTRNDTLTDGGLYPSYFTTAVTKNTYQSWLPSLNLVYEIADDVQLRGAISRTMTRPNPSAMLPGVAFGDPSARQATIGNPALNPYYSKNIDLGVDYYTGGEGLISFTAFRKSLSGFTVLGTSSEPFSYLAQYGITYDTLSQPQQAAIGSAANAANWTITVQRQINASGLLTVNGLEADWVQPLDFLLAPYGLEGFGVSANVTIVDQKGSGAAPGIATGVAPYTYNLTAYYENHGAMVRLQYNFNDRTYASGSNQNGICLPDRTAASCPGGAYLYGAAYGQLDLSSSYRLSNLFGPIPSDPEITFDVRNLTRSKLHTYFQYPSAPFTYYDQGSLFMFGLRGSF